MKNDKGDPMSPPTQQEPTFLEKLRAAREAATPGPWVRMDEFIENGSRDEEIAEFKYTGQADSALTCLLVNNAEKLAALIEVVGKHSRGCIRRNCPLDTAFDALNEEMK